MDNPNMARARAKEADIPPERLRELMDYDPETGFLTSLVERGIRWHAGRRVGTPMLHGYRKVSLDYGQYLEHRVIWAWMTGRWPDGEIDHVNLDRSDNRWANLRAATRGENCLNHPGHPDRRVGRFKGVTPRGSGWAAQITLNRKCHYLGIYPTQEEARAVYIAASQRMHGDRGRE